MSEIDVTVLLDENEALKEEVERLKKELSSALVNANLTIDGYYKQKYEDLFYDIRKARLEEIDITIKGYQDEILKIKNNLNQMDTIVERNEAYQAKLNELQDKYNNNLKLLETKKNELTEVSDRLNNKQLLLTNATLGYYNAIVKSMNPLTDIELVLTTVEFAMHQLKDQLYDLVLDCTSLNLKKMKLEEEFYNLNNQIEKENSSIIDEEIELTEQIESKTKEEFEAEVEDLQNKINECYALQKELSKTYDVIKGKDIKKILDTIHQEQLKETPNVELVVIMEELIAKLAESLKSQDTLENLKHAKQIKLSTLMEERKELSKNKERYIYLKALEKEYCDSYVDANRNLDQLIDFLDSALLAINENEYYSNTVRKYNELKEEEKQVEAQYTLTLSAYTESLKLRTDSALYTYTPDEYKNLTNKINSLNEAKNRLNATLKDLRNKIQAIEVDHNNLKLMIVLREKEKIEKGLPALYENLRVLKGKITIVRGELSILDEEMKNLDNVNKQIETILYELNN